MSGNTNDIVISSRIRLARNVDKFPYPNLLTDERASQITRNVYKCLNTENLGNFNLFRMSSLGETEGNVLKEKHLISADLLGNSPFGAAIINENETISIMVNEEDHIRLQCILPGYSLKEAFKNVNEIDDVISANIKYAFDSKLGYLTSCPTNLGTGLRASAMMFLPALSITKTLEQCVNAVARLNMTIRGVYGEGSNADGYIYQISNQKTLGVTEQEIIESVEASVSHIVDAEIRAREMLKQSAAVELKDKILRAYGILTNAYMIDTEEFMQLFALIKLGIAYDYFKAPNVDALNKLTTDCQPANITSMSGSSDPVQRDIFRAAIVGKAMKSITKK